MRVGILAAAITGGCTLLYLIFRLKNPRQKVKRSKSLTDFPSSNAKLQVNGVDNSKKVDIHACERVHSTKLPCEGSEPVITPQSNHKMGERLPVVSENINTMSKGISIQPCSPKHIENKGDKVQNVESKSSSIESTDKSMIIVTDAVKEMNLDSTGKSLDTKPDHHHHSDDIELKESCLLTCSVDETITKEESDSDEISCQFLSNNLTKDCDTDSCNNCVEESSLIKTNIVENTNEGADSQRSQSVSPNNFESGQLYCKPDLKNEDSKSKRLKKKEKKIAQKESKCDNRNLEIKLGGSLSSPSKSSSSSTSPSPSIIENNTEMNGNVEEMKKVMDGSSDWDRETTPEQENVVDSQSLASQASLDSGQGSIEVEPETVFTHSVHNNTNNNADLYIFYQFEVPQYYVGKLIGPKGSFINKVKNTAGVSMMVLDHPNRNLKLTSVEGTKSKVLHALELIRMRFPIDEFPEMTLEQINTPTVSPDHQPTINRQMLQVELPCGVVVEVQASAVVSGGEVWLQQPLHPSFTALSRLHHCINLNYGDGSQAPGLPSPVQVNTVCVCRFGPQWLRCQVIDSDEQTSVVTLLDIGGTLRLPSIYLKQIRVDYMSLPFQATQCFLHGIRPVNGVSWEEGDRAALEELTKNSIMFATIAAYSQEGIPFVNLYQRSYNQYTFINERMVELGHAKWL